MDEKEEYLYEITIYYQFLLDMEKYNFAQLLVFLKFIFQESESLLMILHINYDQLHLEGSVNY